MHTTTDSRHRAPSAGLVRPIGATAIAILTGGLLLVVPSLTTQAAAATAPVGLGVAGSYSVVGGETVTNTGPTVLAGDLGVSPGTAITGFPPGLVGGTTHAADAPAGLAKNAIMAAWNSAAGRAPDALVAGDLVGQTLTPGVYKSSGPLGVSGTLTLNAQGNPAAVFIFQVGSTLTTATSSNIRMINGAQPCHVYWQIGSSATLGTTSTFKGTILALASITVTTGVQVEGRALAHDGAVTLDSDVFTKPGCNTTPATTSPVVTTPVITTPVVTTPVVTTPVVTTPVVTTPVITTPVITTPVITTPVVVTTPAVITSPVVVTTPVRDTTPVLGTTPVHGTTPAARSGTTTPGSTGAAGQATSTTPHGASTAGLTAVVHTRLAMTGVGVPTQVALAASFALLAGGLAFMVIGKRRIPARSKGSRRH